jgi:hypothetical protein
MGSEVRPRDRATPYAPSYGSTLRASSGIVAISSSCE